MNDHLTSNPSVIPRCRWCGRAPLDRESVDSIPHKVGCIATNSYLVELITGLESRLAEANTEGQKLRVALKDLADFWARCWDRADGCVSIMPDTVKVFDAVHARARIALGEPLLGDEPSDETGGQSHQSSGSPGGQRHLDETATPGADPNGRGFSAPNQAQSRLVEASVAPGAADETKDGR